VASIPVDIGDLPRDNGDELQSLALELYDAAKVSIAGRIDLPPRYFYPDYFDFDRQSRLLLLKTGSRIKTD